MAAIETGLDVAVLEHTTFTSGTVTGLIYKGLSRRVSKASVSDRTLTLNIEYSTFPNWIRTEQKRPFTITGDELKYTVATASAGDGRGEVTLRRAK